MTREGNGRDSKQWRSLEEFDGRAAERGDSHGEFPPRAAEPPDRLTDPISRRRFLALTSATAALAATAACSRGGRGSIVPYTRKPEEIVPGVGTFYASTFQEGLRAHGVLVRTREGRPVHVEGNDRHPLAMGTAPPRAIADLLRLYDPDRLRQPFVDGKAATWDQALAKVHEALRTAKNSGRPVLLLTGAVISPTALAVLSEVERLLPALEHVQWEACASDAEREALKACFGSSAAPRVRLDRAAVVACFEADPLNGEAPGAVHEFVQRRCPASPREGMSRLWVLEGALTLTGAKADRRVPFRPSRAAWAAFAVARLLNEKHGLSLPAGLDPTALAPFGAESAPRSAGLPKADLEALASDLAGAGRTALVVAGPSLPPEAHAAVCLINAMLGAEGATLDASFSVEPPALAGLKEIQRITSDMASGRYAATVIWNVNPAHAHPDARAWQAALAKVPLRVRLGLFEDESAKACQVVLPESHWLESWGDYAPSADLLSLQQPACGKLYDTKQGEEFLLALLCGLGAAASQDYAAYLKARWRRDVYPAAGAAPFPSFWNAALHEGVVRVPAAPRNPRVLNAEAVRAAAAKVTQEAPDGFEILLRPDAKVYDGRYANIGWLQELPDPVSKLTWGNVLCVSVQAASRLGLSDGDVARVDVGGRSLEAPVQVQPGQHGEVLALSLGYGRSAGSVASGVGVNAFPLLDAAGGSAFLRMGVKVAMAGRKELVPTTQTHGRMEGRDLARSWDLAEYARKAGEPREAQDTASLYPGQKFPHHKWGMAIDLSACVGCSGCVLACQSENNIPVVGPEQVAKGREMHWIRVDRYYEGAPEAPSVVHQPMLCQQCDDAPCENVCPVNATTHSSEGLNQMVYNRCVGTRYCANNCPYKVRRFNFFEFNANKREPESLAFNPEVSVRPRGVMEKCTFCVQRIEDAKMRAKTEGRPVRDGEITPACAAACPAEAIVFGDLKDPESRVAKMSRSDRGYKVLEELGVKPAVTYLADLRNPGEEKI